MVSPSSDTDYWTAEEKLGDIDSSSGISASQTTTPAKGASNTPFTSLDHTVATMSRAPPSSSNRATRQISDERYAPTIAELRCLPSSSFTFPPSSSPFDIQLDGRPIIRHLTICDNCGGVGHRWMHCLRACFFCKRHEHKAPTCSSVDMSSGRQSGSARHGAESYPSYQVTAAYRDAKENGGTDSGSP
ncbi:uncharacterized protein L3040_000955 [Drepanopeziza brunnea f. sp. 'multigermtubi']|uniref:CCHC-type domain-containing protein n=1 Tax=Marssonina brunnea f. sp. multigermtubi (strain MB_m1) TaxID=1072389 RepID=K1WT76_MARBU|nr:uncharacterized protein MBM_01532 [Drepanopeziza brunnea f. sp. 'multigermtubi' MB_m1]EKD20850.1 hypothetical protein MBM_01532 [Drepanopeziza brunnea f. sp. 'multigermtubi' MB_m1]KAJ5054689.1 hypothetical protein L3040_000955 [Drepanopeziza brunnea f. sp. 'multigermtubi']